jgi:hypothetical protein
VRLHKNGFPESMTYADFWRRYRILAEPEAQSRSQLGTSEVRPAVEQLLQFLDLDTTAARLGKTQVSDLALQRSPDPFLNSLIPNSSPGIKVRSFG